jgi:hypothetical protein
MRRLLAVAIVAGCYRGSELPQQETLVLYRPGSTETRPHPIAQETAAPHRGAITANEFVLLGTERAVLGAAVPPRAYQRMCVQDQARIAVDGSTRIELTSDRPTVIAGAGIGPRDTTKATIEIAASGSPEIFVLFDNARAPIRAVFDAPNSTVHVAITGKTGLEIDGKAKTMVSYAGWGVPPSFPTCDVTMDREPEPSFPASRVEEKNCTRHNGQSSNYTTRQRGDRELHVIGVYEGDQHVDGVVEVHVPRRDRPVVLALSAYQPTIWRIDSSAKLDAVYLYGYETQRIEGVSKSVRIERATKPDFVCTYGWEPNQNTGGCYYTKMISTVRKATGLIESSFQGCYAGGEFDIPVVR